MRLKSSVFNLRLNDGSEGADVTSAGKVFHIFAAVFCSSHPNCSHTNCSSFYLPRRDGSQSRAIVRFGIEPGLPAHMSEHVSEQLTL